MLDSFGNPVAGISVNFTVTGGGGTITDDEATTDADGMAASGAWLLGESGRNTVVASAAGVSSEPFTAFADAYGAGYVLIRVDGDATTSSWVTGHITLGAGGVFAAETSFRWDGNVRMYAGSGRYELSGNDIVVRITEGDWLEWSLAEPPRQGELIVRGTITEDIVELNWFQNGPDSMTRWTFQRRR